MKRSREDKLLKPKSGGRIAAAKAFGIDLSQVVENLCMSRAERIKANDQAVSSISRFEQAVRKAKANADPRKQ